MVMIQSKSMVMNRLEAAQKLPDNQDDVKQSAIIGARQMLLNADVKDPGMPLLDSIGQPVKTPAIEREMEMSLQNAVSEYKKGPLTPEHINDFWQAFWRNGEEVLSQKGIDHSFQVPTCDRTVEELAELQKENKGVLLVPDELYTQKGLILLGNMFPKMESWVVQEGTKVVNNTDKGGSIDIEMNLDSPNRDTNEKQTLDVIEKQRRSPQRLSTYIVGSQFSKLLTGHYFDEETASRLPGSRDDGSLLGARFFSDGYLDVDWPLLPKNRSPFWGVRFEGVKKA